MFGSNKGILVKSGSKDQFLFNWIISVTSEIDKFTNRYQSFKSDVIRFCQFFRYLFTLLVVFIWMIKNIKLLSFRKKSKYISTLKHFVTHNVLKNYPKNISSKPNPCYNFNRVQICVKSISREDIMHVRLTCMYRLF